MHHSHQVSAERDYRVVATGQQLYETPTMGQGHSPSILTTALCKKYYYYAYFLVKKGDPKRLNNWPQVTNMNSGSLTQNPYSTTVR